MARRRAFVAATYALLLVSCDSPFAPDETAVARLEPTPLSLTMTAGETRPVTVRVLDDGGQTLDNRRLYWSSQNPQVATVSQAGIVTGVAPGATQVAVSAGGKSALIPVTVNARPVSLVRVTPASTSIFEGGATTLTAEALDAAGGTVAGPPAIWSTSNAAVATVTSTGDVTGVAPGTANITATIDGVAGTAIVTVQPVPVASLTLAPATGSLIVGQSLQLTATPRDSTGLALAGRAIAWTSSAPASLSVSSTGLVTALAGGTATITATSEGKSATAQITASPVPVAAITLTPASATLAAGRTLQLVARVVDSTGTPLGGRTIAWTTDQPTIATVDANGLVTGIAIGRATITATVEGKSATATIDVTPVPVASLTITPTSGSLVIGATLQLTATARDAANNVLPGRNITWISGAPSVATVTQNGLVTAVGAGSALIFAASEGVSTSITVTVSSVGVSQVIVNPTTATVQQGLTLQLSATAFDVNGAILTGRTVTWNSAAPTVASVSSTGLVTGVTAGTTSITATVDGVVGTATITVTPTPVASVSIVPSAATMTIGNTLALTLLVTDASGTPLSTAGRTITWASLTPAVATVTSAGVVSAIANGTVTIQATVDGVSGSATITVTNVPVASVTVSPSSASLNVGATQQLTATAKDAAGNTLIGRAVTWSTNSPSVATVDAAGLVTAVGTGSAQVTATVDGVQGSATITVTIIPIANIVVSPATATLAQGAQQQLAVTATDAGGNILTGRTFSFTSIQPSIASVSSAGLVTALSPGTANIVVTELGQTTPSGTAVITVTLVPVARLVLLPATTSTTIGATPEPYFSPTLYDAANNQLTLTGRTITWASLDQGIATVDATTGFVTTVSVNASPARIVASTAGASGTVADTALLTVTSVPVASVTIVQGAAATVHLGAPYARTLTAEARDAGGALLPRTFTWTSVSQSFALVDPSLGVVTGVGLGQSMIIASTGGVADTILVTVDLVPISPANTTIALAAGQADSVLPGALNVRNYTTTPRDSAGNVITEPALGGRVPAWSLAPSGIATVTPSGATAAVVPNSPGTVTVQATWAGGAAPSATLRILVPVASIAMTASPDSFYVGGNGALFVEARDAGNNSIPGRLIQLSSSSVPSVITIGQTSGTQTISTTVTGVSAPGGRATATINATAPLDAVSNSVNVKVLAPVSSIVVRSAADSIFVSASVQATAVLLSAAGDTLTGRPVTWSTGSSAIATAAPTGVVTGVAAGSTTILATAEGIQGSKSLLVQEPVASVILTAADSSVAAGLTQPTTVILLDRFSNTITGRLVTYATSDANVAQVSAAGVISAVNVGTANITATSEGKTSPALPFTVTPAPVASVTVAASPYPNLYPGQPPFPATVQAFDAANNPLSLSGRTIVWSTASSSVAAVAAGTPGNASITPVGVGTTTVTASVDGVSATTPITVLVKPVPVATVTVSPNPANAQVGGTIPFSAAAFDSTGAPLAGVSFTWSSSNAAKATVGTTGTATALDSGTVNIIATATNQGSNGTSPSGSATLNVTLVPIASVSITPSNLVLPSTTAATSLTVDVRNGANVGLPARSCTLASSNPGILAVTTPSPALTDASGQIIVGVKGVSSGQVTLSVTCESAPAATAQITVP